MTRKEKTYKELENEKARGKRRYIERLIETEEAEKEIKKYEDEPDAGYLDRLDGQRSERC